MGEVPPRAWPAWPEFVEATEEYAEDDDFLRVKREIIAQYGEEALRKSWIAVCRELAEVTEELASAGGAAIPAFDLAHVVDEGLTEAEQKLVHQRGCLIVRQVVSEEEAGKQYAILQQYVSDNRPRVQAWPAANPSMLMLYDSPTQIAIRTHPNHLRLQRALNGLWRDASGLTSPAPLLYSDGIRDRPSGAPFLGLGPHIDAGSLCRWADDVYRQSYHHIFAGTPEQHDCYNLDARRDANQYLFPGQAHSRVFRAFQGWTALTPAAPRAGSILLYPSVRAAIAYMLLRPFFLPPKAEADLLDAAKWTFDAESPWFPGTQKPESQRLSRSSHPHLRLEECLIAAPAMQPGDSVWWHTDLIHAVDTEHLGAENASVVFIPACPTTPINQTYIKSQLEATLEGRPPPDYALAAAPLDERTFKGYTGHAGLGDEAKAALGVAI